MVYRPLLRKQRTGDPLKQQEENNRHGRIPFGLRLNYETARGQLLSMSPLAIAIFLLPLPIEPKGCIIHEK